MTCFSRLSMAVSDEISSGRVGTPVFTRLVMAILEDHGYLLPALGEGVVLINTNPGGPCPIVVRQR